MECIKNILLKDLEMMKGAVNVFDVLMMLMSLFTALVTGGASDDISVNTKPQAVILSDSDEDECEQYQPPKSKMVDVRIIVAVEHVHTRTHTHTHTHTRTRIHTHTHTNALLYMYKLNGIF